jgi:hypothetical protein
MVFNSLLVNQVSRLNDHPYLGEGLIIVTSFSGERGFVASPPTKLVISSLSDLSCPSVEFIVACH